MDPPVPYSLRLHTVSLNLDREAAWSGTPRELFDRLWDIESECAANRAEISRLHVRLRRLEDELNQGRGWLDLLSSRLQVLEQTTQRLSSSLRSLAFALRDTLAETVARLRILF